MRFAVVGAGLAGIAAARELRALGHDAMLFEKSRGLGGRLAARRAEGTVLDHGSPVVHAPEGSALRGVVDALDIADRVDLADGIAFHTGATRLPKLLAQGLDLKLGIRLAALRAGGGGLELGDEQGNTHGVVAGVVVTAPAPQAADLLERSPEGGTRVDVVRGLSYDPAVMVLLGLRLEGGLSWEILRGVGDPIDEIRREAAKGRPSLDGVEPVVVRLGAGASAEMIDASDDAVMERVLPALADALGEHEAEPAWQQIKRWRFAVPRGALDPGAVNPPGARIVLAGDTLTGAGFGSSDHHRVYDSGIAAARRIAQELEQR